ncbi:MAG: hypothetical protein J07HR59_01347 [Halorubrum sp. J07HR59]|nr:MAG: hypothetical protein J07HR59_01347 [Halorubrum sp. J07HR59]
MRYCAVAELRSSPRFVDCSRSESLVLHPRLHHGRGNGNVPQLTPTDFACRSRMRQRSFYSSGGGATALVDGLAKVRISSESDLAKRTQTRPIREICLRRFQRTREVRRQETLSIDIHRRSSGAVVEGWKYH